MQVLPAVTVELFDYWLRNSFFWEYGIPSPLVLTRHITDDWETEEGEGGHIAIGRSGDPVALRVLVALHKYRAHYVLQEKQRGAYKDVGEIFAEQLEMDRLRVHCFAAKGSEFPTRFDAWIARAWERNEPVSKNIDGDRNYWTEINRQAEASGEVTQFLAEREIPRSTYYDNARKYGLPVRKSRTKPGQESGQRAATIERGGNENAANRKSTT